MKPGYRVEFVDKGINLLTPTHFIVKTVDSKKLVKFMKAIEKAWEDL